MTMTTGTIDRFATTTAGGGRAIREDLANIIYNISPVDVPFMSNIGRENCKNTFFN